MATSTSQSRLPPGPPSPRLPLLSYFRVRRRGLLNVLSDLAKRYGDVVFFRIAGRPFCLLTDPELIRRVVVTDNALFTKSHALGHAKTVLGEGLLTSEGDLHKRQRKMIAPVFHAQQVKSYADDFVRQAQRMAENWRDGQAIDLTAAMTELTLRVVTKSLFDTELEAEVRPIGQDMAIIVEMFERARNPLAPLLARLPLASNRRFRGALTRLDERISGMIRARRVQAKSDPAGAGARFDLLSLLLMAQDEEGTMSEQQVRDEAVTLFMAGHETTANALIWTWLLLAEHPEVDTKLHEEIDATLAGGRGASAEDVPKLRYTRAVLAESMRLRPPAWVIARQRADAYDLSNDYQLPPQTTILMSQYLVHRDPRWWPEPEAFRPERWLDESAAAARPKYAYFPFGGGPRSCVGEPFAWLEAILLLATLAQRWRLLRMDNAPIELFPTITLRPKQPVRMTIRAR